MTPDPSLRLGVDLGGTKIEAVVLRSQADARGAVDGDQPEVLVRRRVPTPRDEGNEATRYDAIVAATAGLARDVAREAGLDAMPFVGVGMPGSVTWRLADGQRSEVPLVKNSNTTCLNGRPFRSDLGKAVGVVPGPTLAFANDANCFALAETRYGAARGARVAFGVIMGTGVGGGVVLRDRDGSLRTWDGHHGIAGEWGHVSLDPDGDRPCYCGRRGCIEQFLSGPAIEAAYARRSGTELGLAEIAARPTDDAAARETLDEVVAVFGRAIGTLINVLDPDAIVLGGGVSNLDLLYKGGLASVAKWVFNDEVQTSIVKNALGDSAGVIGAALLEG